MRIAYGVHGYSQGHAARALAVLPDLVRHYDVRVYAGGDAYSTLAGRFDVERIPTMRYFYHRGRRSTVKTLRNSLPVFCELLTHGSSVRALERRVASFAPDVVISDAESWTHAVAKKLGIPRIGFDHFGMMVHCKLDLSPRDWLESLIDRGVYRLLTGSPDRVLISSFYRLAAGGAGRRADPLANNGPAVVSGACPGAARDRRACAAFVRPAGDRRGG